MRASSVAASLVAAALPALAALAATAPGVRAPSGAVITGEIDASSDLDTFRVSVVEGARLGAVVKAGKGSALKPYFDLFRPDGSQVDLSLTIVGEGTSTVSVTDLVANATGDWTFRVSGRSGTTGGYVATFSEGLDKKSSSLPSTPSGGTFLQEFPARAGAVVSFKAVVKSGPPLAGAVVVDPSGSEVPGGVYAAKGATVTGKKIPLAGDPGLYGVRLTGGTPGAASVQMSVKIKHPRVRKAKVTLAGEPRPKSLSPNTGRDGVTVTILGTGFESGASVLFGSGAEAEDVVVESPTRLTCVSPPGAASNAGSSVILTVINPDGQEGSLAPKFQYLGLPTPTSVTPGLSPLEGGLTLSVNGAGFRAGYTVEVDGVPAGSPVVASATKITCVTPPHAAGAVTVLVRDEFGRPGPAVPGLTYAGPPAPSAASPTSVPSFGGQTITLTGSDFASGDRVFANGEAATQVAVVSFGTLTFRLPPGTSGPVDLVVEDELGRSGTLLNALTRTPSFQNVTADAVPAAPAGTDFYGVTLAAGDLDGNGSADLFLATRNPAVSSVNGAILSGSRILNNDGTGTFTDTTGTNQAAFSDPGDKGQARVAMMGDLDADGTRELVLARSEVLAAASTQFTFKGYPAFYSNDYPNVFDTPTFNATRVLENNGAGKLTDASTTAVPTSNSTPWFGTGERWQASAAALGDLDGDNRDDVVLLASGQVDQGSILKVTYTYRKVQYYYYYYYYYKDKAILSQQASRKAALRLLRNKGNGTFQTSSGIPAMVTGSGGVILDDFRGTAVAVGDIDRDGDRDIVIVQPTPAQGLVGGNPATTSAVRVFRNSGAANFTLATSAMPTPYAAAFPTSNDFWQGDAVALGDLDGDGAPELLLGRATFSYWTDTGVKKLLPSIRIFSNNGSGTFSEATATFLPDALFRTGSMSTVLGVRGIQVLDIDGDGDRDLLLSGQESKVADAGGGFGSQGILPSGNRSATRVLLNDGTGRFSDATAAWLPAGTGNDHWQSDAFRLVDIDGDGRPDMVLVTEAKVGGTGRPLRVLKNR